MVLYRLIKRVILTFLSYYITFLVLPHPFDIIFTLLVVLLHLFGIISTLLAVLHHSFAITISFTDSFDLPIIAILLTAANPAFLLVESKI